METKLINGVKYRRWTNRDGTPGGWVHPRATVDPTAVVGDGAVIGAWAVVPSPAQAIAEGEG